MLPKNENVCLLIFVSFQNSLTFFFSVDHQMACQTEQLTSVITHFHCIFFYYNKCECWQSEAVILQTSSVFHKCMISTSISHTPAELIHDPESFPHVTWIDGDGTLFLTHIILQLHIFMMAKLSASEIHTHTHTIVTLHMK